MTTLSPFKIIEPLGQGGMATVYRGQHGEDGVDVAIKILTGERTRDPKFHRAFADEVRAVASLNHDGIIGVYDYGHLSEDDIGPHNQLTAGCPFLAMELADSGSLEEVSPALSWSDFRRILLQLLNALAHAHARGLIHRDIKPANVLRFSTSQGDIVKLADFGISHAMGRLMPTSKEFEVSGTPQYMAPEQFTAAVHHLGPWTDLYAVGCLAVHLITGHAPFESPNLIGYFNAHCNGARPSLLMDETVAPVGLEEWIHRLMAPDRGDRFQHAADATWAVLNLPTPQRPTGLLRAQSINTSTASITPTWTMTSIPTEVDHTIGTDTPLLTEDLLTPLSKDSASPAWQPPLPATWREAESPPRMTHLHGAGAGLFGLRFIPLVGRLQERDLLWNAFRTCVNTEKPGISILRGPMGCGTSRLASWLVHRASELGAANYAIAYHSEIPGPVDPIASMLRSLYRLPQRDPESIAAHLDSKLAGWTPADRHLLATLISGTADDILQRPDRLRLFAGALRDEAQRRPLILWFDDVQWGSEALDLAAHICRNEHKSSRLMMVLTIRDEALATRPNETKQLRELQTFGSIQSLKIGPLTRKEHQELISMLLGFDQELSLRLAQRTDGNPLFAVELVGDWIAKGLLQPGPAGFSLPDGVTPPLPDDLFDFWDDRVDHLLEGLDPSAVNIALEVASILGQMILTDEWHRGCLLAGLSQPLNLDELTSRLLDLRLATRTPQGFSFTHGILRETLHRRSRRAGRWKSLHYACASMLDETYPEHTPGKAERLALHLREAGAHQKAFDNTLVAAMERIAGCDYPQALKLLDDGSALLDILKVGDSVDRDHLERLQLDISWQRLETTEVPRRAREFLQRALDGNRPQIVAHAQEIVARIDRRESRTAQAYSGFEAALSYFKANGLRLETARCLEGMAWTAVQAGDIADAQRHYQEVLRLLPDPGFQAIKIVCDSLNGLAEIARRKGDHQRALHWLDRGQVFAEEAGNTRVMADILNSRGEIHREAGQFDLAESYYQQTLDIFLELGGVDIRVGQTNLTLVYLGRREYARALDVATEILAELDCSVATFHCSILEVIIATSLAGLGRFDEAKEHLDRGITLTESIVHVEPDTASILETLAILAAEHHQFELARQALKKAVNTWRVLDNPTRLARAEKALSELFDS